MKRLAAVVVWMGLLTGCGGGGGATGIDVAGGDTSDAGFDSGEVTETDLNDGGSCGVPFDGDPTCEQLSSAIHTVHFGSLSCSAHADCHVSNDPMCGDGSGYPYVWSSATDSSTESCLWDAYWAAGCDEAACDWWAPIPKAACLEDTCKQLGTGCTTDADCGPGQVCLTDEDSGWPIKTYCDLAP